MKLIYKYITFLYITNTYWLFLKPEIEINVDDNENFDEICYLFYESLIRNYFNTKTISYLSVSS